MEFKNLQIQVEGGVATVVVNRPQVLNALNRETLAELSEAFDALRDDDDVRVLILTGAGDKAFVAGADIKELAENDAVASNRHAQMGQALMDKLESLGKPSIAAINGFALGGGLELAMACTVRLVSSRAKVGLPEVTLGIIPGFGGTQRLSRLVGTGRAMHMVLSGAPISAQEAVAWGLASKMVEPEALAGEAQELAQKLASYSLVTLRLAEETVRQGAEMSTPDGMAYEAAQFGLAASTADYREGMAAFLEKRKPAFEDR